MARRERVMVMARAAKNGQPSKHLDTSLHLVRGEPGPRN